MNKGQSPSLRSGQATATIVEQNCCSTRVRSFASLWI